MPESGELFPRDVAGSTAVSRGRSAFLLSVIGCGKKSVAEKKIRAAGNGCHRSGGRSASIKTFPFFLFFLSPSLAFPRSYHAFPGRRSFFLSLASFLDHPFFGLIFLLLFSLLLLSCSHLYNILSRCPVLRPLLSTPCASPPMAL